MTKKAKLGCGVAIALFLLIDVAVALAMSYLISFEQGRRLFQEGYTAMNRREYDTAIARFDAALQKRLTKSYKAYAYENRGYCESRKGRRADALRDYTEALRVNPKLAEVYGARGFLHEENKELDKALNDYSEAIRHDPNAGDAYYRRGSIYLVRHEIEKAIKDFSEAVRCNPNNAYAYAERGVCYLHKNDLDSALANLEAAISVWPNYAWAYLQRGYVYQRKGDLEKARSDFARASQLNNKYAANLRSQGSDKGESADTIADLTEAIRRNPKDQKALEARGLAYSKQGDQKRAITDFSDLLQITRSRRAYDYQAWAYAKTGDYASAIADYKRGAQESGPITVSPKGLAWLLATCPNASFRDGKQAIAEATEDCERTAWKNWNCIDTLAAACAESGDFDRALKYEQQALGFNDVTREGRGEMEKRLALYQSHKPFHEEKAR